MMFSVLIGNEMFMQLAYNGPRLCVARVSGNEAIKCSENI